MAFVTAAAGMDIAGVSRMTQLLADPAHWRLRAQEARQRAKQLDDPEAKALHSNMADKYEDLAARAEQWMNKHEDVPQFLKAGPSIPS